MKENKSDHYIGLGILPPEEIELEVRAIQEELCKKFGIYQSRQFPHITIKSPYYITDIEKHSEYLFDLVRQMESCTIVIKGFNHFDSKVIYINVEQNIQLLKAHYLLLEKILRHLNITADPYEGKNWIPHMSIAPIKDKDLLNEIFNELNKRSLDSQWEMNSIGLFKWDQYNGWSIIRKFKLE